LHFSLVAWLRYGADCVIVALAECPSESVTLNVF